VISFGKIISSLREAWDDRQAIARANEMIDIKASLEIEAARLGLTELTKQATLEEANYLEAKAGVTDVANKGGTGNGTRKTVD